MIVYQNLKAIAPHVQTVFGADGLAPLTFSVLPNGAGGTIDQNGNYSAPVLSSYNPKKMVDTIQVEDANGEIATATIMVLPHIGLIAHIIQEELGLPQNQVSLYQQKFTIPNDEKIYVAVGMLTQKPIASERKYEDREDGFYEVVSTNWRCVSWVEIYSSTIIAFLRKEEVAAALHSTYSEQIQEANNFKIAKLPTQFNNISSEQGPRIPYRFNISVNLSFMTVKEKQVPYFDDYENTSIIVES